MTDVILQVLQQWGAAGAIALAAGYVLYDSWKKNKETEKWMRERVAARDLSEKKIDGSLTNIGSSIKDIRDENKIFREKIETKVNDIDGKVNDLGKTVNDLESKIDKHHPGHANMERARLNAVAQIAPSIHTIIYDGLNDCACDHIAVAMLHNGTASLAGIPYIKFGVIAEKYKPMRCPQDTDLLSLYRDEDIMSHNRLPACIIQNKNIDFEINDESPLADIDPGLFVKCKRRGIKRIAFEALRDAHGLATGFLVIYKFTDEPFDMESFHSVTDTIEHLYHNMLVSFG